LITPENPITETESSQEATTPTAEQVTEKPVPIEVKWNLPAWMLRDPGPVVEVEDDDIDFQ
jgi:hypothetical protein